MATIDVRALKTGKSYRVRWLENGERKSESFPNLRTASAFCAEVERIGEQTPEGWMPHQGWVKDPEPDGMTFGEAWQRFMETKIRCKKEQRNRYEQIARDQYLPLWENWPLSAVTVDGIQHWITQLLNTRSPKTIKDYRALLSGFFGYCQARGWRQDNPAKLTVAPLAVPKVGSGEFYTPQQFAALRTKAHEDVQDLYTFAVGTGMRWGELTALRPEDILTDDSGTFALVEWAMKKEMNDEGTRYFYRGTTKNRRARRVYLADHLVPIVNARSHKPFIFTGPGKDRKGACAWNYQSFYDGRWSPSVIAARKIIHIQDPARFHFLRHTYAWWSMSAGVPLEQIQEQLGHSSIQITKDIYGGIMPAARQRATIAIDGILAGL